MSWYPIAFLPPQIENASGAPYSGAVLKAYAAGTSTVIPMATDYTGVTTTKNMVLNAAGYTTYQGTIVIPHLQQNYKLALYPDQAAADANAGAVWTIDNIQIADSTNTPFIQYFDGDGVTATFTLSKNFGNDESVLMVFADRAITTYTSNSDFATDTVWTKGAGWTIGSGVATAAGAINTPIQQNANSPIISGQSYTVEFTVTASAGTLTPSVGGNAGTTRGAGTWRETIIAGATQVLAFTGVGFTGTLDNASFKSTGIFPRMINRPDEITLVGNQLTLQNIPTPGTKNVIVFSPSDLLGAANNAAAAAATSEANALTYANQTAADRIQTGLDRVQTGNDVISAAGSAAAAAAAAAGGLYNNVDSLTFANSPFVPLLAKDGYLWRIDTSGGNVVVNLSSLATYNMDMQFAFVKVTADANTVTVNRGGTDTINGATNLVISNQFEPHALIGDLQTGTWLDTVQSQGVPNGSVTNAKLANMLQGLIKGRAFGAGTGAPVDLTAAQVRDIVGGGLSALTALLDLQSTTQGFRAPSMTTTQRNAIVAPATGLMVYDNTLNNYYQYNGTAWVTFGSAPVSVAAVSLAGTSTTLATNIPSSATLIAVGVDAASFNGATSNFALRAGVAGVAVSTGYNSSGAIYGGTFAGVTTDIRLGNSGAGNNHFAVIILKRVGTSNTWNYSGQMFGTGASTGSQVNGTVILAGALDSIFLSGAPSTDSFDNGSGSVTHW